MTPQEERLINAKFAALQQQRDFALRGQVEDAATIAGLNDTIAAQEDRIKELEARVIELTPPQDGAADAVVVEHG